MREWFPTLAAKIRKKTDKSSSFFDDFSGTTLLLDLNQIVQSVIRKSERMWHDAQLVELGLLLLDLGHAFEHADGLLGMSMNYQKLFMNHSCSIHGHSCLKE